MDCKSELQAYKAIFKSVYIRLKDEAEITQNKLGLKVHRERDQKSMEYVSTQISLLERYEKITELLLWVLNSNPELSHAFFTELPGLREKAEIRRKNRSLARDQNYFAGESGKLFAERIFEGKELSNFILSYQRAY